MFDRKVGKMDDTDREFEAMTRNLLRALDELPPDDEPLWRRAVAAGGTLLSNLVGVALLALVVGSFAAVARLGWEWVG